MENSRVISTNQDCSRCGKSYPKATYGDGVSICSACVEIQAAWEAGEAKRLADLKSGVVPKKKKRRKRVSSEFFARYNPGKMVGKYK